MRLRKIKKGEITTQQIVILIIVLISFAIILFFLMRLNLGKTTDKEICHNSVVMKGNSALKSTGSLNCKRDYVCLTFDGSCENMTAPELKKVKTVNQTYQVLADEMADCWWMFGEGKIDYVGEKALEKNYCSICTQLAFDNSMKKIKGFESGKINADDFYKYLSEKKMPAKKQTYLEYLFGQGDLSHLKSSVGQNVDNTEKITTFGDYDFRNQYFITMGITSKIGNTYKWIGGGVVVLGLLNPFGWVVGAVLIGSGLTSAIFGNNIAAALHPKIVGILRQGDGIPNNFLAPTIIEANSKEFEALGCKDILTLS